MYVRVNSLCWPAASALLSYVHCCAPRLICDGGGCGCFRGGSACRCLQQQNYTKGKEERGMSNSSAWPQSSSQAALGDKDSSSCCVIYSCRAKTQDSTYSCFVCLQQMNNPNYPAPLYLTCLPFFFLTELRCVYIKLTLLVHSFTYVISPFLFLQHIGPAIPEVSSIWFKLYLYHVTGQGPPSLLLSKGSRLRKLPDIFQVS